MSNFDGAAEEDAIQALLESLPLFEGRIFDNAPDLASSPMDKYGKVAPYIVASYGVPFRAPGKDASFADTEKTIPYTMTIVIGVYAGSKDDLRAAYAQASEALTDFQPTPDNSLPLKIPYAYSSASGQNSTPRVYSKIMAMQTTVNLSPTP